MSRIPPPDNFRIAALDKQRDNRFDPMTPGAGTPWEDRGTHGLVPGFLKTCLAVIKSPSALLSKIRRPESSSDTKGFLVGVGLMWGLSGVIHSLLLLPGYLAGEKQGVLEVNLQLYIINCVLEFLILAAAPFVFVKLYGTLMAKMAEMELKTTPPVLLNTVAGYCLASGLLAPIPFVGPLLTLLLTTFALISGAKTRLQLRPASAVVNTLVIVFAFVAIGVVGFFVGGFVWRQLSGGAVNVPEKLPKPPG